MSDKDCDLVMESIKTEETMIGGEKYIHVKVERASDRAERRRKECKNCELMKTTYSNLKDRYGILMKQKDVLEKKNTELEEINGALYLSYETERKEKLEYMEMCKISHPSSGIQENVYYKQKFIFLNEKYDKLLAENDSNIMEVEKLHEKVAELQRKLYYSDEQLFKSNARFSIVNQEYLALKLKYGEGEDSTEEPPSYKRVKVARSEIIPASYMKRKPSHSTRRYSDETLECETCSETFTSRLSLRSHIGHCRKKNSGNDLSFTNKDTRTQSSAPFKTTSSSGPCICSICNREFARPCNLARHMIVHSVDKN